MKIIIKSLGSISPLGHDKGTILRSYEIRYHCLKKIKFENEILFAGKLTDEAEKKIEEIVKLNPKYKKFSRTTLMAIYSAENAFKLSGWKEEEIKTAGVNISSSRGATDIWEDRYKFFSENPGKSYDALTSPLTTLGHVSSAVAQHIGTEGVCFSHSMTCSSGLLGIANAIAWLKAGMAKRFLVGASEAPLTPFTFYQLKSLGIYSKDNFSEYPCKPFSIENSSKNAMLLGEGAVVIALEICEESEAKDYIGTICSVGYAMEKIPSHTGITEEGNAFYKAMKMALEGNKNIPPDVIITHSPGTSAGDLAELKAIKKLFQNNIPFITCNKWKIGHTYATSGLLNIEFGLLITENPEIAILPYKNILGEQKLPKKVTTFMVNAAGFGGNASSVIISKI